MQRVPVQSSNIASIGYDPAHYLLEIEFLDGAVYQYARVPSHIHQGLMDAESKGGFFARWIRDQYPTTRLDGDNAAEPVTPTPAPSPDRDVDNLPWPFATPSATGGPRPTRG